ncbi:hypothetical protein BGW42_002254 [Actinomortierella wolfii]|nr:hypothetical protein BGW42_002254 [Actinomortierella wolfii]
MSIAYIPVTNYQPTTVGGDLTEQEIQDLFVAIESNDTKLLKGLLQNGRLDPNRLFETNVFEDSTFTWSPLHAAAYYGANKVITTLMEHGANVELEDTWYHGRPLAWAAFGGHIETAKLLLEKYNADKNAQNEHGQVALDLVYEPSAEWQRTFGVPVTAEEADNKGVKVVKPKKDPKPPSKPKEQKASKANHANPLLGAFTDLYNLVINHKDKASGRTLADIFLTLPSKEEYPEYYEIIKTPMSLNLVQGRIKSGHYKTLEEFDREFQLVFENALIFNEDTSRVNKDARVLLKLFNLRKKDVYANYGLITKPPKGADRTDRTQVDMHIKDGIAYRKGEFVELKDPNRTFLLIERLEVDTKKNRYIAGSRFFRPEQILQVPGQTFYEKEVFKVSGEHEFDFELVSHKIYIQAHKDFIRGLVTNFDRKDVYVCECRYSEAGKSAFLIKDWKRVYSVEIVPAQVQPYPSPLKLKKAELPGAPKARPSSAAQQGVAGNARRASQLGSGKDAANKKAKKSSRGEGSEEDQEEGGEGDADSTQSPRRRRSSQNPAARQTQSPAMQSPQQPSSQQQQIQPQPPQQPPQLFQHPQQQMQAQFQAQQPQVHMQQGIYPMVQSQRAMTPQQQQYQQMHPQQFALQQQQQQQRMQGSPMMMQQQPHVRGRSMSGTPVEAMPGTSPAAFQQYQMQQQQQLAYQQQLQLQQQMQQQQFAPFQQSLAHSQAMQPSSQYAQPTQSYAQQFGQPITPQSMAPQQQLTQQLPQQLTPHTQITQAPPPPQHQPPVSGLHSSPMSPNGAAHAVMGSPVMPAPGSPMQLQTTVASTTPGVVAPQQQPSRTDAATTGTATAAVGTVYDPQLGQRRGIPLLQSITLDTDDKSFTMSLGTETFAHSVTVPTHVQSLTLIPLLANQLAPIQPQVGLSVFQNGRKLRPTGLVALPTAPSVGHHVYTIPLTPGQNTLDIWVSAHVGGLFHGGMPGGKMETQQFYPKQVQDIKQFLEIARRKDAKSGRIKKNGNQIKFKVRCSRYLYTLVVNDAAKAEKLKQSLPPTLMIENIKN